eukprot:EG_transcript_13540
MYFRRHALRAFSLCTFKACHEPSSVLNASFPLANGSYQALRWRHLHQPTTLGGAAPPPPRGPVGQPPALTATARATTTVRGGAPRTATSPRGPLGEPAEPAGRGKLLPHLLQQPARLPLRLGRTHRPRADPQQVLPLGASPPHRGGPALQHPLGLPTQP